MDFLRKRKIAATQRKEVAERQKCLLENGGFMLEEMISSFNGKSNPIRSFSASVILKATNNFESTMYCVYNSSYMYKCIIDDLPVLLKWCQYPGFMGREKEMKNIIRDIAVSSPMSSHKNVLKLFGCCLEFLYPVLIYEEVEKGQLIDYVYGHNRSEILPWNIRLKIAKETAIAVSYLHTAFPKRMVHGSISPNNIFLDENWTAKIADFSSSILISDGEPYVKVSAAFGTNGFIDPAFFVDSCINESYDVYYFGTILLILITGDTSGYKFEIKFNMLRDIVADVREKCQFIKFLDPEVVDGAARETLELQKIQWKAFMKLALKCTQDKREDRPDMIDMAKELVRIEKAIKLSDLILD